ncbi:NAD(P)/FAD-dependent oxidoreductase [Pseudonocardia phyllosphaerae]|uniref:NAD(P)/FAD-dependent oxidoreductase n=1 Tax=Pseudonocardia phyllosphaerae TaxID=3390502 RepID=UPI003978C26E
MSSYDVIVAGGGAAGLSAALVLSRARWRVLVIDDGTPRNAPAGGVHNWLTRDGLPPAEIGRIGRAEVTGYGGEILDGRVTAVRDPGTDPGTPGFAVSTADGAEHTGRTLLVTTGLTDELPPIDGLAQRWGAEVFGCPFCHAWEHRDTRIGVLVTGPHDLVKAHIVTRWTDRVTLFLHTGPQPDDEQWAGFAACGIEVVDGEVTAYDDDGVHLASGTVRPVDALTISPRAVPRAGFLDDLGVAPAEAPFGMGLAVPAGPQGQTDVPGLYLAGNVVDPMATVPAAIAAGAAAAAGITRELLMADVAAATAAAAA